MECPQCGKEMEETAEGYDAEKGMRVAFHCVDCDILIEPDDEEC